MLMRILLLTLCAVMGLSHAVAAKGYLATRAVKLPEFRSPRGGESKPENTTLDLSLQ